MHDENHSLFSFGGRIQRKAFILNLFLINLFVAAAVFMSCLLIGFMIGLTLGRNPSIEQHVAMILVQSGTVLGLVLGLNNAFKRARDITGQPLSGLFILGLVIPVVNAFVFIWLIVTPSCQEDRDPSAPLIYNEKSSALALGLMMALCLMRGASAIASVPSTQKSILAQKVADQVNPEALFAQYALNIKKHAQIENKNASQGMGRGYYQTIDQAFDTGKMAQIYLKKFEEFSLEKDLEAELAFYNTSLGIKVLSVQQNPLKSGNARDEFSKRVAQTGVSATRREWVLQYDEITRSSETFIHLERSTVLQLCEGFKIVGLDPALIQSIQDQGKANQANLDRHMKESIFMSQLFFLDHFSDEEVKALLRRERTEESRRNTMASWKAYGETLQSASLEWGIVLGSAQKSELRLK
jgi:uncharacterized membrane protein YhaH (DUF805 family)